MTSHTPTTTAALSPSELMARAAEQVGHDDWGDTWFVDPLTRLVDACADSGRLTDDGRRVLRSVLLRRLRNRLHLRRHLQRVPTAAERDLGSPIVITGLPRTGTTLLHNLLAQDPRHRVLPLWQALHPVPPGGPDDADEATLVQQAQRWLQRFSEHAPGFEVIRPLHPHAPEECDALLQNSFASQHFDDMFDAEPYSSWFYEATLSRPYAEYALQLQVLTGDGDHRRWLLKSPSHLAHLHSLLAVLPQARVLHCHRDPAEAVASYASLIHTVRRPNCAHVDPRRVGEQALWRCRAALDRALAVRETAAGAVVDVAYPRLAAEPMATVEWLYDRLGVPLEQVAAQAMREWLADQQQHRRPHRYEAAHYDLPPERVRTAFEGYLQRFGSLTDADRRSNGGTDDGS